MRIAAALATALALGAATPASAAPALTTGFFDGTFSAPARARDVALDRARSAGARIVRLDVGWTAASRPAAPRDPADSAYAFGAADAAVRAATARGLKVLLAFTGAPAWAEGPNRPEDAPPGSWRPEAEAVGDYGAALARRYDGTYPDPARPGVTLPRVDAFQVWNEPNLSKYLSPQWSGGRRVAPVVYRAMLNAFHAGVRSRQPRATVVTAGTAPFGDFGQGQRTMPVDFWAAVLERPVRFDVLSHHPYSVGAPGRRARNAGDVSIPDMGKLARLVRIARRQGTVVARPRLWVTEVGYDSSPPDPNGVPVATQARWLEETLYRLWLQGVSTVLWYTVADQPPVPSYAASTQGGVLYRNGAPKPARTAFRFPLVATRKRIWTRAPASGTLLVQRRTVAGWRTLSRRSVRAGAVLHLQRGSPRGRLLRARLGAATSLAWRVP